jgi:hypothetical protein
MYVGPYLCVIPGAAAIIERAFQARQAAGMASEEVHVCRSFYFSLFQVRPLLLSARFKRIRRPGWHLR